MAFFLNLQVPSRLSFYEINLQKALLVVLFSFKLTPLEDRPVRIPILRPGDLTVEPEDCPEEKTRVSLSTTTKQTFTFLI